MISQNNIKLRNIQYNPLQIIKSNIGGGGEIHRYYNENFMVSYDINNKRPNYALNYIQDRTKLKCKDCRSSSICNNNFKLDEWLLKYHNYGGRNMNYLQNVKICDSSREDSLDCFFDRGHLTPNADMCELYGSDTFYMTNIIPQYKNHNQGLWVKLENNIRQNYINHWSLTIPNYGNKRIIDNDGIELTIPSSITKIVIDKDNKVKYNITLEHEPYTNIKYKLLCNEDYNCDSIKQYTYIDKYIKMSPTKSEQLLPLISLLLLVSIIIIVALIFLIIGYIFYKLYKRLKTSEI